MALYAIMAGIIIFILNRIYINTNEYKLRCGDHIRQFRKLPKKDLDGIVIGSAQAYYGFDFPREGYNIENLSWAPQELKMCYYIAKENLFRIKKGGVLLICLPFVGGCFQDILIGNTKRHITPS